MYVVTKPSIVLLVHMSSFEHLHTSQAFTTKDKSWTKAMNKKWNSSPKTNRYHVTHIVQSKSLTHLSKTHTYLIFHEVLSSMRYNDKPNKERKGFNIE